MYLVGECYFAGEGKMIQGWFVGEVRTAGTRVVVGCFAEQVNDRVKEIGSRVENEESVHRLLA